jgi:hypothetical protein
MEALGLGFPGVALVACFIEKRSQGLDLGVQVARIDRHLEELLLDLSELKAQLGVLCREFQNREFSRAGAAAHCGLGSLIAPATAAAVSASVSMPMKVAVITSQALSILATRRSKPSRYDSPGADCRP